MAWLDQWEMSVNQCSAAERRHCLSTSTFNGFRVTLKSTVELSEYLMSLGEGFQYVLTSRLGQDSLEVVASCIFNSTILHSFINFSYLAYFFRSCVI
jgi:hypothetical protein